MPACVGAGEDVAGKESALSLPQRGKIFFNIVGVLKGMHASLQQSTCDAICWENKQVANPPRLVAGPVRNVVTGNRSGELHRGPRVAVGLLADASDSYSCHSSICCEVNGGNGAPKEQVRLWTKHPRYRAHTPISV